MSGTATAPMRVPGGAQASPNGGAAEAPKRKRTRSPSVAKPAYIVVQVMDENGQPASFDKKRVKVVAVERQADKVLEAIEAGDYPNAFYLRVVVPAGSRAGSPNKPKD